MVVEPVESYLLTACEAGLVTHDLKTIHFRWRTLKIAKSMMELRHRLRPGSPLIVLKHDNTLYHPDLMSSMHLYTHEVSRKHIMSPYQSISIATGRYRAW